MLAAVEKYTIEQEGWDVTCYAPYHLAIDINDINNFLIARSFVDPFHASPFGASLLPPLRCCSRATMRFFAAIELC